MNLSSFKITSFILRWARSLGSNERFIIILASLTLVKGNNRITNTFPRLHTILPPEKDTWLRQSYDFISQQRGYLHLGRRQSSCFRSCKLRVKGVTIVCDHLRELLEKLHHGERATPHDSTEAERKQKSYNHYVKPQRPLPLHWATSHP